MSLATQTSALATRVGQEIKSLWTTVNAKAPTASPALTGTPTAPTATAGTNTTQIATTAFVASAMSSVSSNPLLLDGGSPDSVYTSSDTAFDGGTP